MTRSSKFILLVLSLLYGITNAFGQNTDYILGRLVDGETNEPVAFASIRIKDAAMGVISNVDGTFRIPLRYKMVGDILEISSMGYRTKLIDVQGLKESEANTIILKPSTMELKEATVSAKLKKLDARELVRIAVARIPQNYSLSPYSMVGYYRDFQVKNGNYTNLNEAVVNVFDSGFSNRDNFDNEYELYAYSTNLDFPVDSFALQPYDYRALNKVIPHAKMENTGGNELITLMIHDAIRNYQIEVYSFVNNIALDFVDNHRFRLLGTTNFKDRTVYEIDCSFRNNDYYVDGTIFLDTGTFAILKLDYTVFRRKKPRELDIAINAQERFTNGFRKINAEELYRIITEYFEGENGKMYLGYISFYNKLLVQRPAPFKSKFTINLKDRSFHIRMNKLPANFDRIGKNDFKITYNGQKVPIKNFELHQDERIFIIYPNVGYNIAEQIFKGLFLEREDLQVEGVKYNYGNIKDSLGNKLDERKWEYLHQYREFFVQETSPYTTSNGVEKDSLMEKMEPLGSKEQHVKSIGLKTYYWMNTPLPNFETKKP